MPETALEKFNHAAVLFDHATALIKVGACADAVTAFGCAVSKLGEISAAELQDDAVLDKLRQTAAASRKT